MSEFENEDGKEMRARIQARDERMKDDLQQNFSGRTWSLVDILGEDAE